MKSCLIEIPDLNTVTPSKGEIDELYITAIGDTKNTISIFVGAKKLYISIIEKKKNSFRCFDPNNYSIGNIWILL